MILEALLAFVLVVQDPPVDERIRELCEDLSSVKVGIREKATGELIKIGRPAVAKVRELLDVQDDEVRLRARAVLDGIEAALRAKALKLEVACDRKTYKPGEKITIDATLKNVEDFPVTAMKFVYDGGLLAECWITVLRDGKPIRYAGGFLSQVIVHRRMTEDRFFVIEPGKSVGLRSVGFRAEWDPDRKYSTKASYRDAKQVSLTPGKYTISAAYAFKFDLRRLEAESDRDPILGRMRWSFQGDSKAMLTRAWQGALVAKTEFEVVEE